MTRGRRSDDGSVAPASQGSLPRRLRALLGGHPFGSLLAAFLTTLTARPCFCALRLLRRLVGGVPDARRSKAVDVGGLLGLLRHRHQRTGPVFGIGVGLTPLRRSAGSTSNSSARRRKVSMRGTRSPFSRNPMVVRWRPVARASCSWETPFFFRASRRLRPKATA